MIIADLILLHCQSVYSSALPKLSLPPDTDLGHHFSFTAWLEQLVDLLPSSGDRTILFSSVFSPKRIILSINLPSHWRRECGVSPFAPTRPERTVENMLCAWMASSSCTSEPRRESRGD
jgi:hypothetical protein